MNKNKTPHILADARWQGHHGIGRFSSEVLSRLQHAELVTKGPKPLSLQNLIWQNYLLSRQSPYQIFFTPGFNAPILSSIPFTLTIHDLIHLQANQTNIVHKLYYRAIVKPALKKAYTVFTVSEYSKQSIVDWANIPPEKIINVSAGVSASFTPNGHRYTPGFPYLLHVGNASKPHKNIPNMLTAFAQANIDKDIKLIFTGTLTKLAESIINQYGLTHRIQIHQQLTETDLASYYRGALGVLFPSTYEGFGLPVLEGMASGVPVLTSNTTSLPEVAGDAAILTNPKNIGSLAHGIEQLVNDTALRSQLISKGLTRSQLFSWDKTAQHIQTTLNKVNHS